MIPGQPLPQKLNVGDKAVATPLVVKIRLPSSTSDYTLNKIVRLITEVTQASRAFGALFRAQTKKEAERVGKYMIRPLLSLKRLSLEETAGKVLYQARQGAKVEQMDYLEFIAHLKLTFEADRPPLSHHVQQELLMAAEESGE